MSRRDAGRSGDRPARDATRTIVMRILEQYALDPHGAHGVTHWARVLENGRRLAARTGASVRVVELFAVFHDACRRNEGRDPDHGLRGAELARSWRGDLVDLPDEEFDDLHAACAHHARGRREGTATVLTCWDADRLDLGRVGIQPRPERLCTAAARSDDILDWASRRGRKRHVVPWLKPAWGFDPGLRRRG